MGERRALLIGVQNDRFGRLDFVPEVVRRLHEVVLDRRCGACRPALADGRELLTGPAATRAAVLLQAKSRHKHLAALGHYVRLGEETSARITADNDPLARRRAR